MAISSADPNFLLVYGLDESLATAPRVNSGSRGSTDDLTVEQSSGTDGIASIADGNGGRAADIFRARTGYTTANRRLKGGTAYTGSTCPVRPALPIALATDDWAFGVRINWRATNTGGGAAEVEQIFGLQSPASNYNIWAIGVIPDDATTPTAAKIKLDLGAPLVNATVDGSNWTIVGAPPTFYILPSEWYRILVRVYNISGSTYGVKIYLYRESTGVTYTFTKTAALSANYSGSDDSLTDFRVYISGYWASLNPFPFGGYIDECWLYDAPISDTDGGILASSGLTIPWVEPSFSQLSHDAYVAMCKEGGSFPKPRQLGVGALKARHPANVRARRFRVRYSGFRPGRPWSLRKSQIIFDSSGPRQGRQDSADGFIKFDAGFVRQPGVQPPNSLVDGRNVDLSGDGLRSRRGFKIRRDVATADSVNSFMSYRDLTDQLFRLYKVNTSLYVELGASATSIDTGYSGSHLPSVGSLLGRLVILTPGRQKTHRSSYTAVESFGITVGAIPTLSLIAGSLTGTYNYAYTEYDSVTGDESAPAFAAAAVSPAAQGVRVTMPAVSSDTRFSKRRIYRTTSGGANTTALLLATITSATTYDDLTGSDGVTAIVQVGGSYITGTPPDTYSACTVHRERVFYYGGSTNTNRVQWTEAGTIQRWYSLSYMDFEFPVRCVIAQGQRLIVFTDYTTEICESDWVRATDGSYIIQRTVVSRTVGCYGHKAAINAHGRVFWIDPRGAWTLDGDQPVPISAQIRGLFPYINTNIKHRIVATYNHIRRQIWFLVAMGGSEFQADTSRITTILVYQMDKNIWCPPYQLNACFADQFDDDLNGLQFGIMDQGGVFKQMETYEGDGIDGSETFTFEGVISTLALRVLTPTPAPTGWTTSSLRGMGITLIDSVTGAEFYTLITDNTTTTCTLLEDPGSGFGSPDLFYVGGIRAFAEPSEQDFGTQNDKVARFLVSEFDKVATTRIV